MMALALKSELEQIESYIRHRLPQKYAERSIAVANLLVFVAGKYGLDPFNARLAGLLHLVAKQMDDEEIIEYTFQKDERLMHRLPPEYHRTVYLIGPASAWYALEQLDQRSEEVFRGIREHTFLFRHPNPLAKSLFVASVLLSLKNNDLRGAVLMRDFLAGRIEQVLKSLSNREIRSLAKTDVRRIARITNPDIDDI